MFVGTMCNSEDTCKTMSLHVRRLNVSFMECQEKETGLLLCTVKCSQVNWSVIKIRKKLPIAIGTMAYQARGIIKAFASVCVEGGGGNEKF